MKKPKILFIYDLDETLPWKDGLWAALRLLEARFSIKRINLQSYNGPLPERDFTLGWGALSARVADLMVDLKGKKGLCVGGVTEIYRTEPYDVLFYETEWYGKQLTHPNKRHAFGINAEIFYPKPVEKIFNYLTVGAFSEWKRQEKMIDKLGVKLAVGQVQLGNIQESLTIVSRLLQGGVMVSDSVSPEVLAKLYRASDQVYIPAETVGGGERSVLEARACGTPVSVEDDNPKLKELLTSPIYDQFYYAQKLEEGIRGVLGI